MELLICFVFILKHLSFAVLLQWWQTTGVNTVFIDLLSICLKTFEYVGKARISELSPGGTMHRLKCAPSRLNDKMSP